MIDSSDDFQTNAGRETTTHTLCPPCPLRLVLVQEHITKFETGSIGSTLTDSTKSGVQIRQIALDQ